MKITFAMKLTFLLIKITFILNLIVYINKNMIIELKITLKSKPYGQVRNKIIFLGLVAILQ